MGVVDALDVVEDRRSSRLTGRPRTTVDQLPFERRDEALRHRVAISVGHRTHRGHKRFFSKPAAALHRRVLTTLVGATYQPRRGPASVDRHVHRIQHELRSEIVRHGPTDHFSRVRVQDERKVKPALPRTTCARVSVVTNITVVSRGLSRAFTGRGGRQGGASE